MIKKVKLIKSFLVFFILLSFFYFYVAARQRYIVTSSIVIRKTNQENTLNLPSIFSSGNQASIEDATFLKTYLKSPEVFNLFLSIYDFENIFSKQFPDMISGINSRDNNDEKYKFFKRLIGINMRESSGVINLRTVAFDPSTAYNLNLFLIKESEKFTNKLNQDIFKKQLEFANKELKRQYENLNIANFALLEFQKNNSTLIPEIEATSSTNLINALESELVKLKVEKAGLQRRFVSNNTPEILDISNQILELSNQIKNEKRELVSPSGKNLNQKLLKFNELKSNLKFARDLYTAALTNQEKMRVSSQENQRFLAILSGAKVPIDEYFNFRHRGFLTSSALIFSLYLLLNFFTLIKKNRRD